VQRISSSARPYRRRSSFAGKTSRMIENNRRPSTIPLGDGTMYWLGRSLGCRMLLVRHHSGTAPRASLRFARQRTHGHLVAVESALNAALPSVSAGCALLRSGDRSTPECRRAIQGSRAFQEHRILRITSCQDIQPRDALPRRASCPSPWSTDPWL